jgi:hypothetical protein
MVMRSSAKKGLKDFVELDLVGAEGTAKVTG